MTDLQAADLMDALSRVLNSDPMRTLGARLREACLPDPVPGLLAELHALDQKLNRVLARLDDLAPVRALAAASPVAVPRPGGGVAGRAVVDAAGPAWSPEMFSYLQAAMTDAPDEIRRREICERLAAMAGVEPGAMPWSKVKETAAVMQFWNSRDAAAAAWAKYDAIPARGTLSEGGKADKQGQRAEAPPAPPGGAQTPGSDVAAVVSTAEAATGRPVKPHAPGRPFPKSAARTPEREALLRELWARPDAEVNGNAIAAALSGLPGAAIDRNLVNVWAFEIGLPYRDPRHPKFGQPRKVRRPSLLTLEADEPQPVAADAPAVQAGGGVVPTVDPQSSHNLLTQADVAAADEADPDPDPVAPVAASSPVAPAPVASAPTVPAPTAPKPVASAPGPVASAPAVSAPVAARSVAPAPEPRVVPRDSFSEALAKAREAAAKTAKRVPAVTQTDIYRPMHITAARRWAAERGMPRDADLDTWVAAKCKALGVTPIRVMRG